MGTLVLSGFQVGCKASASLQSTVEGNRIKIKISDWGQLTSSVVRNEKLPGPVYLQSSKEGSDYSAVLMICTHKGCELKTGGGKLICPCHGAEFSGEGIVLAPPATENLKKLNVHTDNVFIYIEL